MLDSHAFYTFPANPDVQSSKTEIKAGDHELLSSTTFLNNLFSATVGDELTSDTAAAEWRAGGKAYKSRWGAWTTRGGVTETAVASADGEIKFTLEKPSDGYGLSLVANIGVVVATLILSAF